MSTNLLRINDKSFEKFLNINFIGCFNVMYNKIEVSFHIRMRGFISMTANDDAVSIELKSFYVLSNNQLFNIIMSRV